MMLQHLIEGPNLRHQRHPFAHVLSIAVTATDATGTMCLWTRWFALSPSHSRFNQQDVLPGPVPNEDRPSLRSTRTSIAQ